jgi:hypothetical protein
MGEYQKKQFEFCHLIAAAFLISACNISQAQDTLKIPTISISKDQEDIVSPSGKAQTIQLDHVPESQDIKLEDLNFDGYSDVKILKTRGASQEFWDVYMYEPKDGLYHLNKELSRIPCLQPDAENKQLIDACFHESACENWQERYSIDSRGKFSLVERRGTYCAPNGQGYSYTNRFRNGKSVSSVVTPIPASDKQ